MTKTEMMIELILTNQITILRSLAAAQLPERARNDANERAKLTQAWLSAHPPDAADR